MTRIIRKKIPKIKKLDAMIIGDKSGRKYKYGVFIGKRKSPVLVAETKKSAKNARNKFLKKIISKPKK